VSGRDWEPLARAVLRAVLGDLEELDRDRPGRKGACDWRVRRPDGRIAAIEITSHTLPEARQLANEQLRQGPTVADASGLERRWNLHLRSVPRPRYRDTLRAVRERGREVLGCLERRGTYSFAIDDDQDERLAPPEIRALQRSAPCGRWGFEFGLAQSPGAWHTGDHHPAARRERHREPQSGNPGRPATGRAEPRQAARRRCRPAPFVRLGRRVRCHHDVGDGARVRPRAIMGSRAWSWHQHAVGRHAHVEARGRRLAGYPTRTLAG
jgi:hypothetical protein